MANRSYLYSADSLPTEKDNPQSIRCISEHNWDIPLAHELLVGYGTTVVPSMIWNGPLCVAGDYRPGADLLTGLLRVVGEGEVPDRPAFEEMVTRTVEHLEKQKARYFLLEPGEIFALHEDDPAQGVARLPGDIELSVKRAEAALNGGEQEWVESLRRKWPDHFGSFYADYLYYSFPQD
ncbi:hypothetical protein [Thermomonospora catenispora]|uniref:DUF7822 domain-containing protein n=1 Tax=Thermomonospora catenispora TaxID=2493090 RepID=UPI001122E0C3|nr:hypothetical protein [Thermomonospora catenispora]TNY37953.1 hypothetical protein EIO00_05070 [Thermomonospora catenispora]